MTPKTGLASDNTVANCSTAVWRCEAMRVPEVVIASILRGRVGHHKNRRHLGLGPAGDRALLSQTQQAIGDFAQDGQQNDGQDQPIGPAVVL